MDVTDAKPTVVACAPQIRGTVESFGRALDAQEAMKACDSKWEAP